MRASKFLLAATALSTVFTVSSAQAAGFFIQEQSVSAGGSAYAGAATNTKDASTLFFNPAGMTQLDGAQGNLGVQLLIPQSKLTDTGSTNTTITALALPGPTPVTAVGDTTGGDGGNPYNPTPVPSGYLAMPVSFVNGLWAGIGVSNPFGLANKYDADFFGRFDSIKTDLSVTDIQPTLAYQVNDWLSVGGGPNLAFADAELTAAVSNGVSEGTSKLKGNDWGFGYTFGAQIKPPIFHEAETVMGLNYRSSLHFDLDGSTTVEGLGGTAPVTIGGVPIGVQGALPAPNGVTDAKASLATPDVASFGLTQELNEKWKVMGQANWFGWNNFDNITAIADSGAALSRVDQNYQTVWSYAIGAEYTWTPEWTFRGGIQYDNTPTTDEYRTTRTPDGDRTWFSAGATYKYSERISIDGLLTYIHIQDQEIDVDRGTGILPATVEADTEGSVGIVGVALNYKF